MAKKMKWVLTLFAMAGIISAWLIGSWRYNNDTMGRIKSILPDQIPIEQFSENIYKITTNGQQTLFVSIGQAQGYEGLIKCALISDTSGKIIDLKIIEHTETPSYFNKVTRSDFTDAYLQQSIQVILESSNKPDAVSGATFTSNAISHSVYNAASGMALEVFKMPIPKKKKDAFFIRFLDVLIIVFFLAVVISRRLKPKLKQRVRYTLMFVSVLTLGFTYNFHLTISRFNALILGYWPDIIQNLSAYLLVFGVLLLALISGKNSYCHWFCPFGAVQEGIGKISKTKVTIPIKYNRILFWLPRLLAWLAIIIALLFRNPGITSYEVFGKFFTLIGSDVLFVLTLLSLIFSLFIKLPWCNYLCPVPPVVDYIIYIRKQSKTLWQIKR